MRASGCAREKPLSEVHPPVRQEVHRDPEGRRRPEAPGVHAEPAWLSLELLWKRLGRRLVSELRGQDALDAEVRHSASVHDPGCRFWRPLDRDPVFKRTSDGGSHFNVIMAVMTSEV